MQLKYPLEKYPKISVVTIVLNRADKIERSIKSCLAQEYPNLEYLMLDAGSTDGTVKILEKYRDKFDYYRSHSDNGLSAAMNEGLQKASGELTTWLFSDDYYTDNQILLKCAEAYIENPGTEMVNFFAKIVKVENGKEIVVKQSTIKKMQVVDQKVKSLFPNSRLISKACYERCGGYLLEMIGDKRAIYTDYELMKRLAIHDVKNITLPVFGYCYEAHEGSLSFNTNPYTVLKSHAEKVYYLDLLFSKYDPIIRPSARKQLRKDHVKVYAYKVVKDLVDNDKQAAVQTFKAGVKKFGLLFALRFIRAWFSYSTKARKYKA